MATLFVSPEPRYGNGGATGIAARHTVPRAALALLAGVGGAVARGRSRHGGGCPLPWGGSSAARGALRGTRGIEARAIGRPGTARALAGRAGWRRARAPVPRSAVPGWSPATRTAGRRRLRGPRGVVAWCCRPAASQPSYRPDREPSGLRENFHKLAKNAHLPARMGVGRFDAVFGPKVEWRAHGRRTRPSGRVGGLWEGVVHHRDPPRGVRRVGRDRVPRGPARRVSWRVPFHRPDRGSH